MVKSGFRFPFRDRKSAEADVETEKCDDEKQGCNTPASWAIPEYEPVQTHAAKLNFSFILYGSSAVLITS